MAYQYDFGAVFDYTPVLVKGVGVTIDLGAGAGGEGFPQLFGRLVEAVFRDGLGEQVDERILDVADFDAVLGTLRAGQRRGHGGQVQRQQLGEVDVLGGRDAEHLLRLEIGFEGGDRSADEKRLFRLDTVKNRSW